MHSFKRNLTITSICAVAAACASSDVDTPFVLAPVVPIPFVDQEKPAKVPQKQIIATQNSNSFYAENEIYQKIADGVASKGILSSEYALQGAQFNQKSLQQTLFPQITPGAQVDENGDYIARLRIQQVLFDGGRFRAGKHILNAEQSIAFAEHAIQFNERVGVAIDAYLRHDQSHSFAEVSKEINAKYKALEKKAHQRIKGGIGNKTELSLFELKQFESQSEMALDEAEAAAAQFELERLTGKTFTTPPPLLTFANDTNAIPPTIALAIAESKRAAGTLWSERAESFPQLSLQGSIGTGTDLGLGFDDRADSYTVGVELTKPLSWGKDYGFKAARSQAYSARARLNEARRDTNVRLETLNRRIFDLQKQLGQSEQLLEQSKKRVDSFEIQFLSGSVSMAESVGIIDTYKRIYRTKINTRYQLLSTQNEKVQLLGLLGPFKSRKP